MLPLALRFRVFKESAAALFSSFLHLMDFISRHFLTTTQWSSSASISQFSSVNCQVTVPRKLAIIFSLISRNIFKEWQVKTDLTRREETEGKIHKQVVSKNVKIFRKYFPFCPSSDWPPGRWLDMDIVKRDGRNCPPYYSTKGIFIILQTGDWGRRRKIEEREI